MANFRFEDVKQFEDYVISLMPIKAQKRLRRARLLRTKAKQVVFKEDDEEETKILVSGRIA